MPPAYDYLKDPAAIYALSFARVQEAVPKLKSMDKGLAQLVGRIIHASAAPDVMDDLVWSDHIIPRSVDALRAGVPILCDCQMVASGITRSFLPADNPIVVTLNHDGVRDEAAALATTRSAAAVNHWVPHLEGAVVVFGNAPTALFHLLEGLDRGWPMPAAILGFPVGFVGAAESKEALINLGHSMEFITLKGRRGGSAMAAAAVNALAILAKGGRHDLA
jgi:precorrin-8X/cobalt-precorrin-8 methylmutase